MINNKSAQTLVYAKVYSLIHNNYDAEICAAYAAEDTLWAVFTRKHSDPIRTSGDSTGVDSNSTPAR